MEKQMNYEPNNFAAAVDSCTAEIRQGEHIDDVVPAKAEEFDVCVFELRSAVEYWAGDSVSW
jgi:hypothetical protein